MKDILEAITAIWALLPKSEQSIVTDLINDLSNHSVIYSQEDIEFTSKVSHSIEGIRDKAHQAITRLSAGSAIQNDLTNLQAVCNDFLHTAYNISQEVQQYLHRLKREVEAYENKLQGYGEPTQYTKNIIKAYDWIGEADLINNGKINVTNIEPEGYKIQYITAFIKFQTKFGETLYLLAAKSRATLPDIFLPILPFQ